MVRVGACADAVVSLRTFLRYFTSKEDLVLGRLRSHLDLAGELFARRPDGEPLLASLHAVIVRAAADYAAEPERELIRLRLVADTPALHAGMAAVFAGFEGLVRRVTATRLHQAGDARPDLARLVLDNLDDLTTDILARPAEGEDPHPGGS
ncbi:hypothetical protein [Saccharothrix luteola]|uniref:hypothetical protein n=1 Tax=Saccharothrix luteola TaxID=2893018 RepID=UPI001E3377A9|nr:hypothetical protein [Saccharothrix luteola]MCC8242924.1 hypothetical protein [Saccharothrix luteola]